MAWFWSGLHFEDALHRFHRVAVCSANQLFQAIRTAVIMQICWCAIIIINALFVDLYAGGLALLPVLTWMMMVQVIIMLWIFAGIIIFTSSLDTHGQCHAELVWLTRAHTCCFFFMWCACRFSWKCIPCLQIILSWIDSISRSLYCNWCV